MNLPTTPTMKTPTSSPLRCLYSLICLLAAFALSSGSAHATLIAKDSFATSGTGSYSTGAIHGQSATLGVTGYAASTWSGSTGAPKLISTDLSHPLTPDDLSNAGSFYTFEKNLNKYRGCQQALDYTPATGTYYFSALFEKSGDSHDNWVGLMGSNNLGGGYSPGSDLLMGIDAGNFTVISPDGATYNELLSAANLAADETYFALMEINFDTAGADSATVTLYDQTSTQVATQNFTGLDLDGRMGYFGIVGLNLGPQAVADEFRFGTELGDVMMPIVAKYNFDSNSTASSDPEAATTASAIGLSAGILNQGTIFSNNEMEISSDDTVTSNTGKTNTLHIWMNRALAYNTYFSFNLVIPAGTTVDLTKLSFDWETPDQKNQSWGLYASVGDDFVTTGPNRYAYDATTNPGGYLAGTVLGQNDTGSHSSTEAADLSGLPAYQSLTDTTVYFRVYIQDGANDSNFTTIFDNIILTANVTGGSANAAPVFTADPITGANATEDAAYTGQTLAGSATDDDSDPLSYAKDSGPAWLSVAGDGALTGTPTNDDVGVNSFTVSVSDGNGGSDTATLNITVDNTNDAPVFSPTTIPGAEATVNVNYSATGETLADYATDVDVGDTLTYAKDSGPTWLSVDLNTGALSGAPASGDLGANSFTVSVSDGNGGSHTATLNITVSEPNVAPVFDAFSVGDATQDAAYTDSSISATDANAGDTLTYAKDNGPTWLNVDANTGALTGTPSNDDVGANVFTVSVTDGEATVQATLNITVLNVNDAPVFSPTTITGNAAGVDVAYSGTLAGSATDVDAGDTLTYARVSGPAWLSVAGDGTLSGTPTSAELGLNSFTVSVTDGQATVQATLNITVSEGLNYKVFLLGGQSNAIGRAPSADLPVAPVDLSKPQNDILFYFDSEASPTYDNFTPALTALSPGSGKNDGRSEFGPEVSFGAAIAEALPSENIAIIKYARGGSNLHTEWDPDPLGTQYSAFKTTVADGLAAIQAAGHTTEIVGMLWHQGESDSDNATDASNYQANLTAFIADVRSNYGADLPFLIGEIRDNGANYQTVMAAQQAVATADANAVFVPADDLSFQDTFHFDADGMVTLGERFADAYFEFVPALTEISDDTTEGIVASGGTVNYTLTFSVDMDHTTVTAADFENAGTASVSSIGTPSETSPGVFTLAVTTSSSGTLRLQVAQGAELLAADAQSLDTANPITDDTIISVGTAKSLVGTSITDITVLETGAYTTDADATSYTLSAADLGDLDSNSTNFTAAGADKLVVVITNKTTTKNTLLGVTPTVTYDGTALTLGVEHRLLNQSNGDGFVGIWYLDNVSTAGDLVINWGTATVGGVAVGVAALDGTNPGISDTATGSNLANVDILLDGSFALAGAVRIGAQGTGFPDDIPFFGTGMDGGNVGAGYWTGLNVADSPLSADSGGLTNVTAAASFAPLTYTPSGPTVTLSPISGTLNENGGTAILTATLDTIDNTNDVEVNFAFTGDAVRGTDYTTDNTSVTIPAGQTTASITLTAVDDAVWEGNLLIDVAIDSLTTNGLAEPALPSSAALTILEDDAFITPVSAVADDEFNSSRLDDHMIDGSGFDSVNLTHGDSPGGTQWTGGYYTPTFSGAARATFAPVEVVFDLGANYDLSKVLYWNFNVGNANTSAGAQDVEILVASSPGGAKTSLGSYVFGEADGTPTDPGGSIDISDLDASANVREVTFSITSNHGFNDGSGALVGISEVRFTENPNTPPVFSPATITGADATEDVAYSGSIAGSATDADGDDLTYAMVTAPAWLSVAGDGTLSGTPLDADVGPNTFTVSVTDGRVATPVETTLSITVLESADSYDVWSEAYGLQNPWLGVNPALNGEPGADADGDTLTNLQELAFGFDPTVIDGSGTLTVSGGSITQNGPPRLEIDPESGRYYLHYTRRTDYAALGLSITAQFTHAMDDQGGFENVSGGSQIGTGTGAGGETIEAIAIEYPWSLPGSGRKARFGRIEVLQD